MYEYDIRYINLFIRKVFEQFPHKECMSCKSSSASKTELDVKTWQSSFVTNLCNCDGPHNKENIICIYDIVCSYHKCLEQS